MPYLLFTSNNLNWHKNNSMIFKQETIKSWFTGINSSINDESIEPFRNAEQIIWKYNEAIEHNTLTQTGWNRIIAQSDDSLKMYLTSIKGSAASMTGYTASLQGNITGFKKVSSAIMNYNSIASTGTANQTTFANTVAATNSKLGTYLNGLNGAKASLGGYVLSLVGATTKTIALRFATIALNSAIAMGTSFIISGIVSLFSLWINKTEDLISASENALNTIKSLNDELKCNQKAIDDSAKKFAVLSQGIDPLTGKNISLTKDNYDEFLNLSNQLAEMFPALTRNYNENGDAIVQLSGNVDSIVGSLHNLIEAQRDLTNRQIAKELPTIFNGISAKSASYERELSNLESKKDALAKSLGDIQSNDFASNFMDGFSERWIEITGDNLEVISQIKDDYIKILKDANLDFEELTPNYEVKDGIEIPVGFTIHINSSDKDIENAKLIIDGNIEELAKQYETDIQQLNEEIKIINDMNKANWNNLSSSIFAWLSTDDTFKIMDDSMQATIQSIVNNLDWSSLNFSSWEDAKQYIQDNILSLSNDIEGKQILADIQVMLDVKAQFNDGDIPIKDYQDKIQELLGTIKELPDEVKKPILWLFGVKIEEDGTTFSDIDALVNNVKEKLQDEFDDKVGELKLDELQIAAEQIEVPEGTLLSWDELLAKIKEIQDSTSNIDILSIPDTINQLNTRLKPAFDSLKSAYNDIFTDNGEFALDSIDIISTCDSIKSKLDDMAELGLSVNYASFVDFVRVLRDSESTEMDVENAFNSLADSITHAALSGIEDFATTKAALEDLGVVNSEIIAFDALIRNTEALKAAGFDLIAVSQMEKDEADQVIAAFAKETVAAENVSQAIQMLSFQKQLCCLQDMNTASEIANLRTLAENAGYTGEVIRYLTELEQIYQDIAEGTINQNLINSKLRRAENLQALIREATAKVNYKPLEKSAVKAAAKAGAAAGKSYSDALKDELSNLDNVIGYIGDIIGRQINLLEDQKEAAVEALEAEKEAAEEALEAEKKLLQEKLDAKQAEINKIEDSAKARKEEIDLQKAQYDLARMQNQRTILQYTEGKGMHYVTDTKEIRQAKEAVTEAAETIKISGMQKEITEFQSAIDGLDQRIEESNQHYDTLIRQTEKYWDSLIKGLDDYKSRWQELSGIEEKAKMEEALGNLGITTDHILDMSETALESFKSNYLNLLREMYSGNQDMLNLLQEFSGISTDTLLPLAGNIGSIAENLYGTAKTADSITENLYGAAKTADGITENLYGAAKAADGITENLTGSGNVTIETLLPPYDPDKDPTNFKEIYRKWNAHMADIENITDFLYSNINYPFNRQIQDTMNQLNNYTNIINNRNAPPVITQNITLNCPNVTNTSGVEYLQRELGHLSLMARQEPLRRY